MMGVQKLKETSILAAGEHETIGSGRMFLMDHHIIMFLVQGI
jgi:hypothetical protein